MKRTRLIFLFAGALMYASQAISADVIPQAMTFNALKAMDPACDFYLLKFNGRTVDRIRLSSVAVTGNLWRVGSETPGLPTFEVEIKEYPKHLALILKKATGDFDDRSLGLQFTCRTPSACEVVPLDYMGVNKSRKNELILNWPYLWNKNPDDPLGGFAIAWSGMPEENDQRLAEIWATEALPHPDIGRPWTEDEVWKWIDAYYQEFAGLSETTLSASTQEELYYLTDKMKAAGIRRIYLHTDTWREEYWPRTRSFVDVNPKVFPGGRKDLKKYSAYVHANGMLLRLHNVSGGIGPNDPEFVNKGVIDPRLEAWFRGRMEATAGEKSNVLRVRPDPGVSIPSLRFPYTYWYLNTFVVGQEILRLADIADSDGPVWTLKIQGRGLDGSSVAAHPAGEKVTGLYSAYGQNYVPDPKTDLVRIMARRYSELINEAQLDHQHYDGSEIHRSEQAWGFDKFTFFVAQGVNRPTTTSTSGGVPSVWNLERRFSKIQELKELGYWPIAFPLLLDGDRNASSWLDAHYEASSKILHEARRLGLQKPEPMFGVSKELLENHGLATTLMGLVQSWKKVVFRLNDRDLDYIRQFLSTIKSPLGYRSQHHQSRDVLVMEERDGKHLFVPTRILCREALDAPWITGQEFGPVAPRQYVQPGETLQLVNPYSVQTPGLIIRVLPAFARREGALEKGSEANEQDDAKKAQLDDYRTGTDGGKDRAHDAGGERQAATELWPKTIGPAGLTQARMENGRIVLTASNPSGQPYCSVDELPSWSCNIPLRGRRALGLTVVGDGSGSVLLVQLQGRGTHDYVIKIDFTGTKQFVIPHGEAAWNNAAWGWRMAAAHFDYSGTLSRVKMGVGYLPPNSQARIAVTRLELLENVPSMLRDPVFQLGEGTLTVKGEIRSGEYLTYEKDAGVKVYDRNWNLIRNLSSETRAFEATSEVSFRVNNDLSLPQPWLEVQVLTRGTPHELGVVP